MIDKAALEDSLFAWCLAYSGLAEKQIMIADQNAPAPKTGTYLTLKLGTLARKGYDQAGRAIADDGTRRILGNREWGLTLQAYRDGSDTALQRLAESIEDEAARATLTAAGIVVYDVGDILNTTVTVDRVRREQHTLEVFLRVASDRREQVGYIEHVEIEGTTQSPPALDHVESITVHAHP